MMDDFLEECLTDLAGPNNKDYRAFQETFCTRCRNPQCKHAKWAADQFGARVSTQVDRFFKPLLGDVKEPKYAMLVDFQDRLRQAMQLEIANKRGDWEVPEIPILDGRPELAGTKTTSAVDEAIRQLAGAKGNTAPSLPSPDDEAPIETPGPPQAREVLRPPVPQKTAPPAVPSKGNTPVPEGGILLGGPSRKPPAPAVDPWAVPAHRDAPVVSPGATIRFGGGSTPEGDQNA